VGARGEAEEHGQGPDAEVASEGEGRHRHLDEQVSKSLDDIRLVRAAKPNFL